jgi:hypothetical protein
VPRRTVLRAGTLTAATTATVAAAAAAGFGGRPAGFGGRPAGAAEDEVDAVQAAERAAAASVGGDEGDGTGPGADVVRTAGVVIPPPAVVTRAQWGADEAQRVPDLAFAPVRKFVVHHSATAVADDPAETIRAIYRFHVQQNGWNDIAYNFLVDPQGRVYEGRYSRAYGPGEVPTGESTDGRGVVGAHTLDHNTGSCGVCILGNYVDEEPSEAAMRSLVHVLAWKAARHGVDPLGADPFTNFAGATTSFANVVGHRELVPTACPGGAFFARLPALRNRVAARLRSNVAGYRILLTDGVVARFGEVVDAGDPARLGLAPPFAGITAANGRDGCWVYGADGGVFAFGDAGYHGSLPGVGVRARVVDLASTPSGRGYWMLGADGAVFSFGDAAFCGSLPGLGVAAAARKLRSTPSGAGYWVLGADGGVFAFGDAEFRGSVPGAGVSTAVVDLWPTPSGGGYWVLGADGGTFAFGDALFAGSLAGLAGFAGTNPAPVRALVGTPTGGGYWVLGADGGLFAFGDAPFLGSVGGQGRAAVGFAVTALA